MTEESSRALAALLHRPTDELIAELGRSRNRLAEWSRQQTVATTLSTDHGNHSSLDEQDPTERPESPAQSIDAVSGIPPDLEKSSDP